MSGTNPYVEGTADGVLSCDWWSIGTLEVKCPFKHKSVIALEAAKCDKEFCLDENLKQQKHRYYTQVQLLVGRQLQPYEWSWCVRSKAWHICITSQVGKMVHDNIPQSVRNSPCERVYHLPKNMYQERPDTSWTQCVQGSTATTGLWPSETRGWGHLRQGDGAT